MRKQKRKFDYTFDDYLSNWPVTWDDSKQAHIEKSVSDMLEKNLEDLSVQELAVLFKNQCKAFYVGSRKGPFQNSAQCSISSFRTRVDILIDEEELSLTVCYSYITCLKQTSLYGHLSDLGQSKASIDVLERDFGPSSSTLSVLEYIKSLDVYNPDSKLHQNLRW